MRIDAHQHFWRYDAAEYAWMDESMAAIKRDFLPGELQPQLEAAGMDACVAVQARSSIAETRMLLELARAYPFVAGVVGWVDLQAPDVERQLQQFEGERKLVGVRHIVQSEPDDFLLRPAFARGIAALEAFGLAYDLLVYPPQLPAAIAFVSRFPRMRFVLDHLAKPYIRWGSMEGWRDDVRRLAEFPNVFCKLSGLVTEADWQTWNAEQIHPYLDVAFDAFGADRLMIGSDWPVCTLAASYERTLRVVIDYLAGRSPAERELVLGGTAARFWNLTPQETGV